MSFRIGHDSYRESIPAKLLVDHTKKS
jgi:hypothetical protein